MRFKASKKKQEIPINQKKKKQNQEALNGMFEMRAIYLTGKCE